MSPWSPGNECSTRALHRAVHDSDPTATTASSTAAGPAVAAGEHGRDEQRAEGDGSRHQNAVARISPTGSPAAEQRRAARCVDRVGVDAGLVEHAGAPQRRGHQHRAHPGGAVVGLEREGPAVGQRDGVAGLGAGLADRAGDRA